jgi:hypothetical protein
MTFRHAVALEHPDVGAPDEIEIKPEMLKAGSSVVWSLLGDVIPMVLFLAERWHRRSIWPWNALV